MAPGFRDRTVFVNGRSRTPTGPQLLAGEVVHGDRILEQRIVSGDYGDAAFGDEVTLAVGLGVVADGGALGNMHVAVEDRLANAATAADADMREQDAVVHLGVGVDAHVVGEDGVLYDAAGDDASVGDDGIERGAGASGFSENEFRRGILALVGADRPLFVVQVEDGRNRDDVHVGFVVGFERAYVAPVARFFLVLIDEIVGKDTVVVDHLGQNILAEVMAGLRILSVLQQNWYEHIGVEQINAHRPCDFGRIQRGTQCGLLWFFLEAVDAAVFVDIDDAEAKGFFRIDLDGCQRNVGSRVLVLLHHLAVVHLVDVVAGKNKNVLGLFRADGINVLVNGVGRALIPLVTDSLHGRQDFHELAYLAAQDVPAFADVPVE